MVECCSTAIYDLEQNVLIITYEYAKPNWAASRGQRIALDNDPFGIHQALVQGRYLQLCQLSPKFSRSRASILACPIFDEQSILADIWLFQQPGHIYNDLEIRLVQQVTNQCAIAIRQARLYQAAQSQVEALQKLHHLKDDFLNTVSHELRTPLFNIKSFIETLHDYGEDLSEAERREFLATANHETDRLTRLVNDVLDLSRLESCRIYHFNAVDLAQAIEQTLRTYQLNAKDKGIELIQEVDSDLPPVLGHYDLLVQVLANLVGNALKFTKSGGKVVIRAYPLKPATDNSQKTPQVRIEISDTGIGIDPEDQQAIFDRFFRVENRVHTLEGTGLGLSIVRNIIDKHHTTVHLVSEVSVGTTFWFDLTVFQEQAVSVDNLPLVEVGGIGGKE